MNCVRKPTGRDGEDESVRICTGREGGLIACAYTLYEHLLFLRNTDFLKQLKSIATIHEVNNVRSSQSSTVQLKMGSVVLFDI